MNADAAQMNVPQENRVEVEVERSGHGASNFEQPSILQYVHLRSLLSAFICVPALVRASEKKKWTT
jgi:hypothetical protein